MRRSDLEHVIRAVARIASCEEVFVIGSQAILGAIPEPPSGCAVSMEADILIPGIDDASLDEIEAFLGEGSRFHETHGYYVQPVDESTAILPADWRARAVRVQGANTDGKTGWCLSPVDILLSKGAANRQKDWEFNGPLVASGAVKLQDAVALIPAMPLDAEARVLLEQRVRRIFREFPPA